MSHTEDSEDDIWEYKPLGKKKKSFESFPGPASTCKSKNASKKYKCSPAKSFGRDVKFTEAGGGITNGHVPHTSGTPPGTSGNGNVPYTSANPGSISKGDIQVIQPGRSNQEADTLCSQSPESSGDGATESAFCPICQMPFAILLVQSQMGHVAECLDIPRDDTIGCPDGVQCSSNILQHYRTYNHTLLARSRAANTSVLFSLSQAERTPGGSGVRSPSLLESTPFPSSLPSPRRRPASPPTRLTSSLSSHSSSPVGGRPAPTPMKNGLLLLRSPRQEDFKKKKGWMTPRQPKAKAAVEPTKATVSSGPRDANGTPGSQGGEKRPDTPELPPFDEDSISFSPLSELPAELDEEMEVAVEVSGIRKTLFPPSVVANNEEESEDSLELFSDDDFLNDFLDHLGADATAQLGAQQASASASSAPMEAVCSSAAPSNPPASTALGSTLREARGSPAAASGQSPQSVVLERLRQTLNISNSSYRVNDNNSPAPGPSQATSSTSTQTTASRAPALSRLKAGPGPGLKQTDIGVFFGLKPLKDQQGEPGGASQDPRAATTGAATEAPAYSGGGSRRGSTRGRGGRGNRGAGRRAAGPTGTQADTGTGSAEGGGPDSGQTVPRRGGSRGGGGGRGGGRGGGGGGRGWRRWNRGGAYGDTPRNCPFYKKIPGTGFAIDAFDYGRIEGISSYFLTHFHSDHYGGLTKTSTVPIYCNKITGNLVRSKLRVEEQYLHILPMNTRVTVDSVEVILMEANHCPGAAMLLFFLPDGQIVLHTGDFRADPKMESYPELLSCRVQTLYLDTTYCSPEYTFPTQQEAVSFAANTAFELVALHPRTLVVCGSYSIGKEKVFLALAEILGSKVCLSRDKYNTMCCLESEPIKKLLTTDLKAGQVHVLSMSHLNVSKLQAHLSRFSAKYDRLVAFKPTGWSYSKQMDSVDDIQPQITGNITVYGVPYSEHSSFLEMKRFVQWLRPLKIIPTVNAGSRDSRRAMEQCFREWLAQDNTSH